MILGRNAGNITFISKRESSSLIRMQTIFLRKEIRQKHPKNGERRD
jgi:hypothetical protein